MSKPKKGHNADTVTSPDRLKSFVGRIEHVEEEQSALSDDKKAIYAEAKANGYDVKIIRALIARRKKDPEKLREFEELLDLYISAVGDFVSTPLGESAKPRDFDA